LFSESTFQVKQILEFRERFQPFVITHLVQMFRAFVTFRQVDMRNQY